MNLKCVVWKQSITNDNYPSNYSDARKVKFGERITTRQCTNRYALKSNIDLAVAPKVMHDCN
jgi:hypothetical protein